MFPGRNVLASACCYLLIVEKYKHFKLWFFSKSCLNKRDLILQVEHRNPTQHGLPGVYFKLEVLSRWDRFRLDIHWGTKARLTVTHRQKPKEMVFFHEQDKWKSRSPYCSCSDFKTKRATKQRLVLFLESVPHQGRQRVRLRSQNRQQDISPVCSITNQLLSLNWENWASVSAL